METIPSNRNDLRFNFVSCGLALGLYDETDLQGHPLGKIAVIRDLADRLSGNPESTTERSLVAFEKSKSFSFGDADGVVHARSQPQLSA